MPLVKYFVLFLCFAFSILGCKQRYAYRSTVRKPQQKWVQNKNETPNPQANNKENVAETRETNYLTQDETFEETLLASNDSQTFFMLPKEFPQIIQHRKSSLMQKPLNTFHERVISYPKVGWLAAKSSSRNSMITLAIVLLFISLLFFLDGSFFGLFFAIPGLFLLINALTIQKLVKPKGKNIQPKEKQNSENDRLFIYRNVLIVLTLVVFLFWNPILILLITLFTAPLLLAAGILTDTDESLLTLKFISIVLGSLAVLFLIFLFVVFSLMAGTFLLFFVGMAILCIVFLIGLWFASLIKK